MLKSKWFVLSVLTLTAPAAFAGEARRVASRTGAPARAQSVEADMDSRSELPVSLARPNAFSLELLGRGVLYTLNYDRSVTENVALGIGFAYVSTSAFSSGSDSASVVMIPVYTNLYLSSGTSRAFATVGAEFGIGSSHTSGGDIQVLHADGTTTTVAGGGPSTSHSGGVLAVAGFGYEYRSTEGFLFRAAPYLLVGGGTVLPWLGLSAGATF